MPTIEPFRSNHDQSYEPTTSEPATSNPSPGSGDTLHFSNDSPVMKIDDTESIKAVVQNFRNSVDSYSGDKDDMPVSMQPLHDDEAVRAAEGWEDRASDAIKMANSLEFEHGESTDAFHYPLSNRQSAAVMSLEHSSGITEIKYLASHPGTAGAGQTMIETAVNESEKRGNEGRIGGLDSLDEAVSFYHSMGFSGPQNNMSLDPEKSDLWSKDGNEWSFNKLKGQKYGTFSQED